MKRQQKSATKKPGGDLPRHVTVNVSPPKRGSRGRYCHVKPSVVHVPYGGTVTFKVKNGCGPLEVFVPTPAGAPKAFPRAAGPVVAVPLDERGRTFGVTTGKGRREYPYAVYCRGCNCFGRGSVPKMIIGPESA
jgi:hypothetical protein